MGRGAPYRLCGVRWAGLDAQVVVGVARQVAKETGRGARERGPFCGHFLYYFEFPYQEAELDRVGCGSVRVGEVSPQGDAHAGGVALARAREAGDERGAGRGCAPMKLHGRLVFGGGEQAAEKPGPHCRGE